MKKNFLVNKEFFLKDILREYPEFEISRFLVVALILVNHGNLSCKGENEKEFAVQLLDNRLLVERLVEDLEAEATPKNRGKRKSN